MHHTGTVPLETPRLTLRRLSAADGAAMFQNWAGDPAVTRWLRWAAHPDPETTQALLAAWECLYANADNYQWGIVERATGALIGSISLCDSRLAEPQRPSDWRREGLDFSAGVWEPGYCLGRRWWGRGYATEALRAVTALWFGRAEGSWLACCHAVENPASGRVMEKAGFAFDHDCVCHKFNGTPVPSRAFAMTRQDWERTYAGNGGKCDGYDPGAHAAFGAGSGRVGL